MKSKTVFIHSAVSREFYEDAQKYADRNFDGNLSMALRVALKKAMQSEQAQAE